MDGIMNYNERDIADSLEKRGFKVFNRGWPDFLVVDQKRNTAFALEIKVGRDELSEHQMAIHKYLELMGVPVYVCKDGKICNWRGVKMLTVPVMNQIKYHLDQIKGELIGKYAELRDRINEIEVQIQDVENQIQETPENFDHLLKK